MAADSVVKLSLQFLLVFSWISALLGPVLAQSVTPCVCDLLVNSCDFNCCCDVDCDTADKSAFTTCKDSDPNQDNKVCVSSSLIQFHNTPYASENTGSGLFCIIRDNYAERNYFLDVSPVTSESGFSSALSSASQRMFEVDTGSTGICNGNKVFKKGDKIYIQYKNLQDNVYGFHGYLNFPKTVRTSECDENNPAGFLVEEESSCSRKLSKLQDACESTPQLNALNYWKYFSVFTTPAAYCDSLASVEIRNITNTTTTDLVDVSTNETAYSSEPVYNATTGVCHNVVTEVRYVINYATSSGSLVISSVSVNMKLEDISATEVDQKFSFTFIKDGVENVTKRSGNPGYLRGQPIIAGTLSGDGNSINFTNSLKLPIPELCSDLNASPLVLNFGVFVKTGCVIKKLTSDKNANCSVVQTEVMDVLRGVVGVLTHVAMFGNSAENNPNDWIKIIATDPSLNPDGVSLMNCKKMVMGLQIKVLYGNVGYTTNPQPKIVGLKLEYDDPVTVTQQLTGAYSSSVKEATFEVSTSVSFIDVSATPQNQLKPIPKLESKAPYDFFSPFV